MKLHDHPRTCMCSECFVEASSTFGSGLDLLSAKVPPPGVTTVATTLVNEPLVVPMEAHPLDCGIFSGPYDPTRCTCGWYFPILLPGAT